MTTFVVSAIIKAFVQQWQLCAAGQDSALLAESLEEKPLPIPKRISIDSLPPIAWTRSGQSNDIMRQLVNYGDRYLGLNTIESLGNWVAAVAPQLPGFAQFASQETKNDLARYDWAYRWAKSHFKSARKYAAITSFDYNAAIAAEARSRVMAVLDELGTIAMPGIKKLWQLLSATSKQLFGCGIGWKVFKKYREIILERIEGSRKLGLSKGSRESKSSFVEESAIPLEIRAGRELKKGLAQLSTARSMTPSNVSQLSRSSTPLKGDLQGGGAAPKSLVEFAMGDEVIIQQPGSVLHGIKTRVTGKAVDAEGQPRYRLEHRTEGQALMVSADCLRPVETETNRQSAKAVIKATAAQLLQVLGQACPFVGPGLWEVKQGDVPAKAWGQLLRLVGEA